MANNIIVYIIVPRTTAAREEAPGVGVKPLPHCKQHLNFQIKCTSLELWCHGERIIDLAGRRFEENHNYVYDSLFARCGSLGVVDRTCDPVLALGQKKKKEEEVLTGKPKTEKNKK